MFTALFIVSFAGLILFSGTYLDVSRIQEKVNKIGRNVETVLRGKVQSNVRKCGEEICIDLYIHFPIDKDSINLGDRAIVKAVALSMKKAFDQLTSEELRVIELVIEGHTDNQQPGIRLNPRDRFLYNWNLSSRRATAVLYEFSDAGMKPPRYNIVAIGYADSQPLYRSSSPHAAQNRRTTLRIRVDSKKL
ncbi:MAG: OmpA family protein [Bacteroidota bacterium]